MAVSVSEGIVLSGQSTNVGREEGDVLIMHIEHIWFAKDPILLSHKIHQERGGGLD